MTRVVSASAEWLLRIQDAIRETSEAYLVVALESNDADRVHNARENTFRAAKAIGVDDLIDVVIPRASMPQFFRKVRDLARSRRVPSSSGAAGDGNVDGARAVGWSSGPVTALPTDVRSYFASTRMPAKNSASAPCPCSGRTCATYWSGRTTTMQPVSRLTPRRSKMSPAFGSGLNIFS